MRIGIDARFYSSAFTGIGRYVYELVDRILRMDDQNTYVLFFNRPQFDRFAAPRKNVEKVLANAEHYSFAEQWHFRRVLYSANLDLMHFTHFNAPILYRKPSIVTIHDLTISLYPGRKFNTFFHKLGYDLTIKSIIKRAKKIIAVSDSTKRDLVAFLGVAAEKICVIYEGVNRQFHKISDARIVDDFCAKIGLTKPYILYTGVWRNHKNLVNLVKAFAILKNKYKFPGRLVITGNEDPWYPEVKQTVKNEGMEGEVRFTGLVPEEDLVLLYNGALLYVLPSYYEGFGLTVLEAFACGVPVCASKTSSIPEICGEGNAVFFNPYDPEDMAAKIASIYPHPEKMEEFACRGYERLKDFSWEKMASQTLQIYNEVLNDVYADSKNTAESHK